MSEVFDCQICLTMAGPMFNVFWYTHHLFILYWGLLIIHGTFVLKNGTLTVTLLIHIVVYFSVRDQLLATTLYSQDYFTSLNVSKGITCFQTSWHDRLVRGSQDTILQLAVAHPSKVIELQMKKASFKYKPGSLGMNFQWNFRPISLPQLSILGCSRMASIYNK